MGKIKKAAADKHGATLPPVLSEFVSQILEAPVFEIPKLLRSFPHQWPFPRGDLYHWIPVLDRFDEILEQHITRYGLREGPQTITPSYGGLMQEILTDSRSDFVEDFRSPKDAWEKGSKLLADLGFGETGDDELAEAILRFSRCLLDNCGNRSLYNSSERLNDLLNTSSTSLLLEVLRLGARLALRYNFSRVRSAQPNSLSQSLLQSHYNINLDRIQKLADPLQRISASGPANGSQNGSRKGKEKAEESTEQSTVDVNDFSRMAQADDDNAWSDYTKATIQYYNSDASTDTAPTEPVGTASPTPVRRTSGLSRQQSAKDADSASTTEPLPTTSGTSADSRLQTLVVTTAALEAGPIEEILASALPTLPKTSHFEFLIRLHIAKAFLRGRQGRLEIVEMRLLAILNLAYIYPEKDFQNKILASDSDEPRRLQLTNQLAEITRPTSQEQPKLPISLKTTALSTLEALAKHKVRFGDVCAALQINVNHGIIFQVLHEAIAELGQDKSLEFDEKQEEWRDALLSLLEAVPTIGGQRTGETLIGAGFFDMLIKELELRSAKAERVHYKVLMFIITISHIVRESLQTFANSKGFDVISDLLAYEVRSAIDDVKAGKQIPNAHRSQIMDYQMPFFKQQTLRWLFKFINSMLSSQGGNVERLIRNLIDSPQLLGALKEVIENAKIFGANTWSGAINVVSSFIHNEPTSYAVIVEAGLSKSLLESICQKELPRELSAAEATADPLNRTAFKVLRNGPDAIKVYKRATTDLAKESPEILSLERTDPQSLAAGILAAFEPISQIPHAFGALCLNASGQRYIITSNVLDTYLQIFESPAHVKLLATDVSTAKVIGAAFEELMRHHTPLKHDIIRSVVVALARVNYLVGKLATTKDEGTKLVFVPAVSEQTKDANQIDANGDVVMSSTSNGVADTVPADKNQPSACDYLSIMINFLQGFCENDAACEELVRAGAVHLLMELATSPSLPYNFNSRSESMELSRVLHNLADKKPHLVLPDILVRTEQAIEELHALTDYKESVSFFDKYISESSINSADIGTPIVKSLLKVHTLTNILQECLSTPIMSNTRSHTNMFTQVNMVDYWNRIVVGLLKIQPVCIWEEILLLKNTPSALLKSTLVHGLRTGNEEADRALGIQPVNGTDADLNDDEVDGNSDTKSRAAESLKHRTENVAALRYLLSQVPLTITPLLQALASSLITKKMSRDRDSYIKQHAYSLAESIIDGFMDQLNYVRINDDMKDCYSYFMVILTALSRLLVESSPDSRNPRVITLLLIVMKRQENGLKGLNNLLGIFMGVIQDDHKSVDSGISSCAMGCFKIILNLYSQLASSRLIADAPQTNVLHSEQAKDAKDSYYHFNMGQLIVDVRYQILSEIKVLWDTLKGRANATSVKYIIDILRTVFDPELESGARKISDGQAMRSSPDKQPYQLKERVILQVTRGTPEKLAQEAFFRTFNNHAHAEEYCEAHQQGLDLPSVPPSSVDVRLAGTPIIATPRNRRSLSGDNVSGQSSASRSQEDLRPADGAQATDAAPQLPSLTDLFPDMDATEHILDRAWAGDQAAMDRLDGLGRLPETNDNAAETNAEAGVDEANAMNTDPPQRLSLPAALSNIAISTDSQTSEKKAALDVVPIETLDSLRGEVRQTLMQQVLEVMSTHEGLAFDLSDLIIAATKRASDPESMRSDVCETLITSLVSFMGDDFAVNGKKIADYANLLAVMLQNEDFYITGGAELKEYFGSLVNFVSLPADQEHTATSSPWVSQMLVLLEKMLAEDVLPVKVSWIAPKPDADGSYKLPADHVKVLKLTKPEIDLEERRALFDALLNILPKVNKDLSLGLSIARTLVILTRDRELAEELGKKQNLQRLFLMIKQLAGVFDQEFQKTILVVLRHIIEDEQIIKETMRAEIVSHWKNDRHNSRKQDLGSLIKSTSHLAIRSPEIYVEIFREMLSVVSVSGSSRGEHNLSVVLKTDYVSPHATKGANTKASEPQVENDANTSAEQDPEISSPDKSKATELKAPTQEKPDTVTNWLLSQLLQFKDVEDQETTPAAEDQSHLPPAERKPPPKPEWNAEQHPLFHYRSFLMESLVEMLQSYQCAKVEFLNFRQDNKASTPSKPRGTMLNYLMTRLIPIGTLEKPDSTNFALKKKEASSQWAIGILVALCLEASPVVEPYRHEDNTVESNNELLYVRKFVVENSFKAFKDATAMDEPLDAKYGRLMGLADLFCRLLLGRALPKNQYTAQPAQHVQKAIAKVMFEKNYIAMLTSAIADIDLNFPNSRRCVKYLLRPLKLLTETAIELSQNGDILAPPGTAEDDSISIAASVSDVDMDREETPDLFRNSTLGILEPGHDEGLDSESGDEDEEIYEEGYDEEMDYEEELPDDDEVISDEDEELDDADEPIEGLPGDIPMDVEVIINGEHSDSDDDDEDDEDDNEGHGLSDSDSEALREYANDHEDEWEDEDDEDDDDEDDDLEDANDDDGDDEEPQDPISQAILTRVQGMHRIIEEAEQRVADQPGIFMSGARNGDRDESTEPSGMFDLGTATIGEQHGGQHFDFVIPPAFITPIHHDVEDDEDEDEDMEEDEDVEADYDDEGDHPLWIADGDEAVPVPRHHTHHHHTGHGLSRRHPFAWGGPDEDGLYPPYRAHPQDRPNAGIHPLLQRTQSPGHRQTQHTQGLPTYNELIHLVAQDRRNGSPMTLINSIMGAMGPGGVLDLAGPSGTVHVQIGGRDGTAVLPFPGSNSEFRRMIGQSQPRSSRNVHQYDHNVTPLALPARTSSRWQFEAMMLCGGRDEFAIRARNIIQAVEKALVPVWLEENKTRLRKEREAIEAERKKKEAERKADDERKAQETAARLVKEREEQEAAEREAAARAAEAGDESSNEDNAMEGVETAGEPATTENAEPTEPEQPRVIATFRGREVDISGLGIDLEYLNALPDELREEVLMSQLAEQRSQAAATGQESDEISPEFLAALPDDIRRELLQQEARDRRRREAAARRSQAQADGQAAQPEEMDPASFLASLDPGLRASVLAEQDDEMLANLPPDLAAEARALVIERERRFPMSTARLHGQGLHRHTNREAQTDAIKRPKRQIVQMLDKPGVATMLKLLFVTLQGNSKDLLNSVLRNISQNRQNRAEVIGLLLNILQEGSSDVSAIEKSFTQLSLRAKHGPVNKTPLKRTNTGLTSSTLTLDMSPASIIQHCLSTLVFLTEQNLSHVSSFFLTENEGFAKSRAVRKTKGKDNKITKFPLNALITLLDRPVILDSAGCMEQLSTLLRLVTQPLTMLLKKDKKTAETAEKQAEEATAADAASTIAEPPNAVNIAERSPAEPAPEEPTADATASTSNAAAEKTEGEASKTEEPSKKQRNLVPPTVPDENLYLVVSILAARECSAQTFRDTVSTITNLCAIPGVKDTFGKELINQAQALGAVIAQELDKLIPQIKNAKNSADAQGAPAVTKFAAPSADQAKLLRVLTALDFVFAVKRSGNAEENKSGTSPEDVLAGLYESASFGPLWQKLSECLAAMKDKSYILNVATILLPLIESLMVICKNTALRENQVQAAKEFTVTSPEPESLVENLFFRFTEEHRKILNDLVRHNPRLMSGTFSLLVKNPKVLEFDNKRNYFTRRLHSRNEERRVTPALNLPIRRDRTFMDSFQALYYKSPKEIKYGKLNIRFHGEEGVDAGGVTREWFQVMARQMFDPNWALFIPVAADRTTFHPNRLSHVNEPHLMWFKFIGRIIGKALYEGRALDCHFSRAVYKKILGKSVSVKDMETLDLEYYKSLVWMLENDITDVMTETFSVESEAFGVTEVVDLIENGRNIPLTEANKQEYVQLIVEYRLIGSVKEQLENFLIGFHDIVPPELIAIFNEQELELLISGLPEIDVEDWKANTDYHTYTFSSPQIQWFWRAVRSFDKEERAKLLQFVTGTSKVPLNGFKELEGMNGFTRFNIHRDYGNKDRLPSSHTCFNQLDLPEYESYEILRERLYTAITTGGDYFGFA